MNDVLSSALRYHAFGWSMVPCGIASKQSTVPWNRYQTQRPSEATIRKWCARDCNLAIVGGPVSGGLVIRDFDVAGAYERWASEHPDWAAILPTVRTARGYHVYARMVDDVGVRNLDDGELRGHGGYTLAPPSIHPSGSVYSWRIEPVGELPI